MLKVIKKYKKVLLDFIYSFLAYALPTIMLQFVIQPLIAGKITAEENGLFIALFNVIKLVTAIFIVPLANLRLLKKKECEEQNELNSFFNALFIIVCISSVLVGSLFNIIYHNFRYTFADIIQLLAIILLISIHDYYMIEFRLLLNYKKIVVDNLAIVLGYIVGIVAFIATQDWEWIFIIGYLFGSGYILVNTRIWKKTSLKPQKRKLFNQYMGLSTSSILNSTSTYCDRMIIYPILGGYDVSVYNAASIVSKAIMVVSTPIRNVLLSYIVDNNGIKVKRKKIRKLFVGVAVFLTAAFLIFNLISQIACKYLYPKYANDAQNYIPVIIMAVLIETMAGLMNILLLRFAKIRVQTIISGLKLGSYLLGVWILAVILRLELWGFCMAILLSSITHVVTVGIILRKHIELVD